MEDQKKEGNNINDVVIVGSGPAGLTAAIYASRARLSPILLMGETWGGQLMNTTEVENFPGFPDGIKGPDLMLGMIKQAEKFGTILKYANAEKISVQENGIKVVSTKEGDIQARSVILATGSIPRKLGIPGEDKFYGKGVSTCATCDAAFYKEKVVAVIGGGDSAMEEATFLTRFASKVYIIHRREEFRASKIMAERALKNEKIEVLWNTEVREVLGEETVTGLKIFNNKENKESNLDVSGMFLAIGHIPSTQFLTDLLDLDENGYVKTMNDVETNVPGIFVAGEIQDHVYKQAITTAADGCKAALKAQRWLEGSEEIKNVW
ncbi:thioredoxin-disulfide reductase [Candidatus Dojkabacteria bacterium]|uniref:Thioredoxin reductase n=1 Tax=Candidatus Dojkabacteria bacterium TaxID=2099670 RepID=A0A955L9L8_9BACT|nr:thioredoxin-disulfide reductase [Candidatus Dojkabacteria bacterium]